MFQMFYVWKVFKVLYVPSVEHLQMLNTYKCWIFINVKHLGHVKRVKKSIISFSILKQVQVFNIFKICLCAYDSAMASFFIVGTYETFKTLKTFKTVKTFETLQHL